MEKNLKREIEEYIIDNLEVEIETDKDSDYGNTYDVITIKLLLNGKLISSNTDYINS